MSNPIVKVKRANLNEYLPYYGSDEEEDPMSQRSERKTNIELDAYEQYQKQ